VASRFLRPAAVLGALGLALAVVSSAFSAAAPKMRGVVVHDNRRAHSFVVALAGGRLVAVHCERRDLEREFHEYCHTDAYSDRVGELAFGTNLALDDMIGILLQDEKVPGVHLAFGDPYGSQTGADWKSSTHVDVLTRECDVWIDDQQVIADGRYLLEDLGVRIPHP